MVNNMERLMGSEYLEARNDFKDHEIRSYFTDVGMEAQTIYPICFKSHSLRIARLDLNPDSRLSGCAQDTTDLFIPLLSKHFECHMYMSGPLPGTVVAVVPTLIKFHFN